MTSAQLTELLQSLCLLGAFLLLGVLLRARVRLFQQLFLPANVLGGLLLLLLGPQGLNALRLIGIPDSWFDIYNLLPGVLIVPIVTAVPLGLRGGTHGADASCLKRNAAPLFFIMLGAAMLQYTVGYLTQTMLKSGFELYDTFGAELPIGFVGGHGTAGTLGNLLTEMGLDYALTSQGVATATATFGLLGGVIIGIGLINWAARKGYTTALADPRLLPEGTRRGFERDTDRQESTGRETTNASSVDTCAFHAALILLACGGAYLCTKYLKNVPVLRSLSVWTYGMLIMALLWFGLCALKLDFLVDSRVCDHITGPLTDFAVTAAVASLPIRAVTENMVPILCMVTVGLAGTVALLLLCRRVLRDCWFEQMIASFGMATGVFITGILLLRIVDPESKTPALSVYSVSYTVMSCVYFATMGQLLRLPLRVGAPAAAGITALLTAGCVLMSLLASGGFRKQR